MIDKLCLTPFALANVPPPMCLTSMLLNNSIVSFSLGTNGLLAVLVEDCQIFMYRYQPSKTKRTDPPLELWHATLSSMNNLRRIIPLSEETFSVIAYNEEQDIDELAILGYENETNSTTKAKSRIANSSIVDLAVTEGLDGVVSVDSDGVVTFGTKFLNRFIFDFFI